MKIVVYKDHWQGWSIWIDGELLILGHLPDGNPLEQYCNQNYKKFGFAIGLQGWEL